MKYYTGKGDKGKTDIAKKRVKKNNKTIELIGTLDELNAFIGYSISKIKYKDIKRMLKDVELKLYYISSIAAGYRDIIKNEQILIREADIKKIEEDTDILSKEVKPIVRFLYPNGNEVACIVNVCRAVTRRTERRLVSCKINDQNALRYINRLSSLLFVIFRVLNQRKNTKEETFD